MKYFSIKNTFALLVVVLLNSCASTYSTEGIDNQSTYVSVISPWYDQTYYSHYGNTYQSYNLYGNLRYSYDNFCYSQWSIPYYYYNRYYLPTARIAMQNYYTALAPTDARSVYYRNFGMQRPYIIQGIAQQQNYSLFPQSGSGGALLRTSNYGNNIPQIRTGNTTPKVSNQPNMVRIPSTMPSKFGGRIR